MRALHLVAIAEIVARRRLDGPMTRTPRTRTRILEVHIASHNTELAMAQV